MRKSKKFEIDEGVAITIHELRIKQILNIIDRVTAMGETDLNLTTLLKVGEDVIPMFVTGITYDELLELAPSEIEGVYEIFEEVNATFLSMLEKAGIKDDLLGAFKSDAEGIARLPTIDRGPLGKSIEEQPTGNPSKDNGTPTKEASKNLANS